METILVNNDRKVTNAGIPADQLVKTFVIISAPPLSDIALNIIQTTNYWQIVANSFSLSIVFISPGRCPK